MQSTFKREGEAVKTIKVRTDKKTGDCYLKLSDFKSVVDISKVTHDTLEPVYDGDSETGREKALILIFFDAKGNRVCAK